MLEFNVLVRKILITLPEDGSGIPYSIFVGRHFEIKAFQDQLKGKDGVVFFVQFKAKVLVF